MQADFFTRLINAQAQGPNVSTNPGDDYIVSYVCPSCEDEHDDEEDANECCPRHIFEVYRCAVCRTKHQDEDDAAKCCPGATHSQPMQCPVCLRGAENFEIAADCCLHVHPTITAAGRARIASAVARGTPWPQAVQENIHH